MKSELVVRLPSDPRGAVYWWTPQKAGVSDQDANPVENLRAVVEVAAGQPCLVLVPGERVGFHSLELQGKLTRTVEKTLPWRLEDELAEDVTDLHFSVLGQSVGRVHLAVVARSWMSLWQSWLSEAGLESRQWLPDNLALPWSEGECTLLNLDDQVLIRSGTWEAAVCDSDWAELYLEGLFREKAREKLAGEKGSREKKTQGDHSSVNSASDEPDAPETGFNRRVLNTRPESPLATLVEEARGSSVNLLQGEWQPQSGYSRVFRPWKATAGLMVVTLLVMAASSVMETSRLQARADAVNQEARAIYQQLFPGERVVRLESQLNQKLSQMKPEESESRSGLPALLDSLAPVFLKEPALKPGQLDYDYDRQELRMVAQSAVFESFSRFRESAQEMLGPQISVTVQSIEQDDRSSAPHLTNSPANSTLKSMATGTLIIRWNTP